MGKAQIYYFPLRGRAEVIRLALAFAGADWDEVSVDYAAMKSDRQAYPFGQCPRLVDGEYDISQSGAAIRYLARKHNLDGQSEAEKILVDMLLEGVESLRLKYINLIYNDKLDEAAKATYWTTYLDKATTEARNGGAHLTYLSLLVQRAGGPFATGAKPTVADFAVWDIVELHHRIFGEQLATAYPELLAHHAAVGGLPGVSEYLAGPVHGALKINGNGLG